MITPVLDIWYSSSLLISKKGILEACNKDGQMYGETSVSQPVEWIKTLQPGKKPPWGVREGGVIYRCLSNYVWKEQISF